MATSIEYAEFSAYTYNHLRSPENWIDAPAGWARVILKTGKSPTGFGGAAFFSATGDSAGELVVAYEGTAFGPGLGSETIKDFFEANVPLATGGPASQLREAVQFYFAAMREASTRGMNVTSVSFTGHSLGGGLASLMAVWFNRAAVVFAAAPFGNGARSRLAMTDAWENNADLRALFPSREAFITSVLDTYDARKEGVQNIYVDGELLATVRAAPLLTTASRTVIPRCPSP